VAFSEKQKDLREEKKTKEIQALVDMFIRHPVHRKRWANKR
jgi:hypothetical protein